MSRIPGKCYTPCKSPLRMRPDEQVRGRNHHEGNDDCMDCQIPLSSGR